MEKVYTNNAVGYWYKYLIDFNRASDKAFFSPYYENTPIQIFWKFQHQKLKVFR